MNDHQKLSAPLRGAEHYNQIEPSSNVRKTLDTTIAVFPGKRHQTRHLDFAFFGC